MATIVYDLDEAVEVAQPSAGWHPAVLTGVEIALNRSGSGHNLVLSAELAEDDPDRPGMPWTIYIPLPGEDLVADYEAWKAAGRPRDWDPSRMTRDGRHRYNAAMARLRKVSAAFGGPESGKFRPESLARFIGRRFKINLVPDRSETGEPTGRMSVAFDGIAPA